MELPRNVTNFFRIYIKGDFLQFAVTLDFESIYFIAFLKFITSCDFIAFFFQNQITAKNMPNS